VILVTWRLEQRDDWPPEGRQFSLLALFGVVTFVAFAAAIDRVMRPSDVPGISPVVGCLLVFAAILAAPAVGWVGQLLEPRRLGMVCLMFLPLSALLLAGFALMPGVGRATCMALYNMALCLGIAIGGEQRRRGYRLVRGSTQAKSSV
jgi:hypothetical protein